MEDIKLLNPAGDVEAMPPDVDIPNLLDAGYKIPTFAEYEKHVNQQKYGDAFGQLITGLEGAAEAATLGTSTAAEVGLGIRTPYQIRAGRQVNPVSHMFGQGVGLVGSSLFLPGGGAAGAMEKAGAATAKGLGLGAEGAGMASRIGAAATRGLVENMIFQAGDEVSKMFAQTPGQTYGTAAANIGLAGILGAGISGAIGSVSPLWEAASGSKLGQFIEDFKGRVGEHLETPDKVGAVSGELRNHYETIKDLFKTVYGESGVKTQELKQLMPEMNENIFKNIENTKVKVEQAFEKLGDDPLAKKLRNSYMDWRDSISSEKSPFFLNEGNITSDPWQVFEATDKFKRTMQEYSKFEKQFPSIAESDFIKTAKEVSYDLRKSLEDTKAWGKAGERQAAINEAFSEFKPTLKDFNTRFTYKKGNDRFIDEGKLASYVADLDAHRGVAKKDILETFINSSDKYKKVIGDTYANLGMENPVTHSPLTHTRGSFKEITAGQRAADTFIKKNLGDLAGKGAGIATGAAIGKMFGAPGFGALIGEHALSPFFNSILPAIIKPFLGKPANAAALKAAIDYGVNVSKGHQLIQASVKGLFKAGTAYAIEHKGASEKNRAKLDKQLELLQNDPFILLNQAQKLEHYMPGQAEAAVYSAGAAISYLLSIKPDTTPLGMLNESVPANPIAQANYNRALDIANDPLILMNNVKAGTLTEKDMTALKTMYPGLYDNLSSNILMQLIDNKHKGIMLPYSTKLGISTFLGAPVDASMIPMNIMSAQGAIGSHQLKNQMQAPGPKSMKALTKMPNMYATPQQSRMMGIKK